MADHVVNIDELKAFYKTDTSDFDWLYQEAIDAAGRYLKDETARDFTIATTSSARSYRPERCASYLWIHDCTSITSVVENGVTLVDGTDYVKEPLNGITASGETRPYDRLARYATYWYWDGPKTTVTVTATWGWASLPAGYRMAHFVCAKAYMQSRDISFGLAALSEAGGVGEREAKAVRDFISNYRGHSSWGVA